MMGKVKLTRYQLNEMCFKGEVMRDDGCSPDTVAGSYGFTPETLAAFNDKLASSKGTLHLTEQEAAAVYGELGNAADIAEDNVGFYGPEDAGYRAASRSYRNAQDKVLAVFPNARS